MQRVGFRRFCLDLAQEFGISGLIRNLADGSVELIIQGDSEKIERFLSSLNRAPKPIVIREISKEEIEVDPSLKYFRIEYGPLEEELQEGFGAMQSLFMEYWDEFRDYREEFREFRDEFRDYREEFREFRDEFRDYREEFREFSGDTRKEFNFLLRRYGEISEKLTEILETLREESRETREELRKAIEMLANAIEKIDKKIEDRTSE